MYLSYAWLAWHIGHGGHGSEPQHKAEAGDYVTGYGNMQGLAEGDYTLVRRGLDHFPAQSQVIHQTPQKHARNPCNPLGASCRQLEPMSLLLFSCLAYI